MAGAANTQRPCFCCEVLWRNPVGMFGAAALGRAGVVARSRSGRRTLVFLRVTGWPPRASSAAKAVVTDHSLGPHAVPAGCNCS